MQITFNKRELLEFPNWAIAQSKFSNAEYILIKSRDYDHFEFKRVLHFLEIEKFKTETGKNFNKFIVGFDKDKYDIIISPKEKTFITQASSLKPNWPKVSMLPDEFRKAVIAYHLDFFDTDHLEWWMKYEKGIEFVTQTVKKC